MKGLRSTNGQLQNCHGNIEYNIGTIVSSTALLMYSARWVLDLLEDHFICYINNQPLCYKPEVNITLN